MPMFLFDFRWDGFGRGRKQIGQARRVDALQCGTVELGDRSIEDDTSVRQSDHAIGKSARQLVLVQADHGGYAVLPADPMDQFKDSTRGCGIEACDGLVGENGIRSLDQRARDSDALLLAAGQLVGAAERPVQQLNPVENLEREAALGSTGRG
jgi:hypothetical protein